MPIPQEMLFVQADLYRPFGSLVPIEIQIPGRLVPDAVAGRKRADGNVQWTHYLDVDEALDIRDGCTRTAGANELTYADGDEIRLSGGTASYAVVWVEVQNEGTPRAFKRVYLMRHSA